MWGGGGGAPPPPPPPPPALENSSFEAGSAIEAVSTPYLGLSWRPARRLEARLTSCQSRLSPASPWVSVQSSPPPPASPREEGGMIITRNSTVGTVVFLLLTC